MKNHDEMHQKIIEDLTEARAWIKVSWWILTTGLSILVYIVSHIFISLNNIELTLNEHKQETTERVARAEEKIKYIEKFIK